MTSWRHELDSIGDRLRGGCHHAAEHSQLLTERRRPGPGVSAPGALREAWCVAASTLPMRICARCC